MSARKPISRKKAKRLVEECVTTINLVEYAHAILSNVDLRNQSPEWVNAFRKWEKLAGYSPVR